MANHDIIDQIGILVTKDSKKNIITIDDDSEVPDYVKVTPKG